MIPDQKPISDSDLMWVERDAKQGLGIAGSFVLAIIARLRAAEARARRHNAEERACPECGGPYVGYGIGRLEEHQPHCSRFPL